MIIVMSCFEISTLFSGPYIIAYMVGEPYLEKLIFIAWMDECM